MSKEYEMKMDDDIIRLDEATINVIKRAFALDDLNTVTYDKEALILSLSSEVSIPTALLLIELIDDKKEEYGFTNNYELTPIGIDLTFARDYIGSQLFRTKKKKAEKSPV
jgi:hypothetical protein